jgi:hypothetical protein
MLTWCRLVGGCCGSSLATGIVQADVHSAPIAASAWCAVLCTECIVYAMGGHNSTSVLVGSELPVLSPTPNETCPN